MAEVIKTEALVLYTTRWHETSKIVHLFTEQLGDIKVLAKGALRPKSPFRGILEALNHLEVIISLRETRGLQILSSATLFNAYMDIRENLSKTAIAFSILELLKKFFQLHEPVQDFFHYVIRLLQNLNECQHEFFKPFLWHFLLKLSEVLGFGWNFSTCLICEKIPDHFPVFLDSHQGGIICGQCSSSGVINTSDPLTRPQWEFLDSLATFSPDDIDKLSETKFSEQNNDIFTNVLLKHLSFHTETVVDLKSLKWYM